jgi:hypothetical protein
VDPALVARLRGRQIIQQELGDFRSFASTAAHRCSEIDEEEFFELVARNLLKGMRYEVSKIFGATKASKLLDPFNG